MNNNEKLIEEADALYDQIGTRVFREEFRALYVAQSEKAHTPTDTQVDAAIRGFHEFTFGTPDDGFLTPERLATLRDPWRAALRAAWGAR